MTLTTNEQAAVNDLSAAVETLATDLGQVQSAAVTTIADLRAQVSTLTATGAVSTSTIAALNATIDGMEADVVGALAPLTSRVNSIDSGLKTPPAQGGSPLTPTV